MNMIILDLPNVVLVEIFEYLSYEEVSKKRLVCRRIDQICQRVLSAGFNRVVRQHSISSKRIKSLLPRRESERRNHFLARHSDILTSIETRISMLSMTYGKYMDLNLCCFIPGKVLDEIFRILRLISKTKKQLRPHEVLQELRDISSMAIEHFDEKIVPLIKKPFNTNEKYCKQQSSGISLFASDWFAPTSTLSTSVDASSEIDNNYPSLKVIQERVNNILSLGRSHFLTEIDQQQPIIEAAEKVLSCSYKDNCKDGRTAMTYFRKLEIEYKKGLIKMHRMQQYQAHQSRRMQQTMTTVNELSAQLNEVKKRLEEVDAKNRELAANIKQMSSGELPTVGEVCKNNVSEADLAVNEELSTTSDNVDDIKNTIAQTGIKRRHNATEISSTASLTTPVIALTFQPIDDFSPDVAKKSKVENI